MQKKKVAHDFQYDPGNPFFIRPVAIVYIVTANIASGDLPHLCQTRQGHGINWWRKKVRRWSFVCPHPIEIQLHSFLMLTLDGGERLTSCPSCFTPGRDPGRAKESVWTIWRRKNLLPHPVWTFWRRKNLLPHPVWTFWRIKNLLPHPVWTFWRRKYLLPHPVWTFWRRKKSLAPSGLDILKKKKISWPYRDLTPRLFAP